MKNGRTIFKLFLSYILLAIPMVLCSFLVANAMIGELLEKTNERIDKEILQIEQELNTQLICYKDNAVKLATIWQLSPTKILGRGDAARQGMEYLDNIRMMDDFRADILLCYQDEVYTNTGYCRPETYLIETLDCEKNIVELGIKVFQENKETMVYLPSPNDGYLLFHYPLDKVKYAFLGDKTNSINYCVSSERIYSLLESMIEQMDYCMRITFENEWQTEHIYLKGSMEKGIEKISSEEYALLQEDISWSVRKVNMALYGMNISIGYDASQLYEQVVSWQRLIVLTMGILLFLSVIISYWISRTQYEKIYDLKESLQVIWSADKKQSQSELRDEFDYMHMMIRSIAQETSHMRAEVDSAKKVMCQQGAMLLFYGGIREENAALGMLESCDVELQDSFFAIVCVTFMNNRNIPAKALKYLTEDRLSYVGNVGGKKTVIALIELSSEDYTRKQRKKVADFVWQDAEGDVKIAFSRPYENILHAATAYREATMVCLQLQQTAGEEFACADTWISIQEQMILFEESDLTELENAVSDGQRKKAKQALETLLSFTRGKVFNDENRKYLRYCIIQSILLAAKDIKKQDIRTISREIADIDLNNEEDFTKKIRVVLNQICPAEEEDKEKVDFAKVVEYIGQNFHRYDLSLDEVAEFAGLSKAYMSRLFKEKAGSRYIDYLTACRMDHAKRLLLETDMNIKQIAEAVGYCNVDGFRNKFKNYFGVNCAEIRKKYKSVIE